MTTFISTQWRTLAPSALKLWGTAKKRARAYAVAARARWSETRTVALQVSGFGCIVAAAWYVAIPVGLLAAGIALLVIEGLGAGK